MRVTSLTWLCHTGRLATSVLYPTAAFATAQNVFFNFGRTAAGFGPLARGCHQRRLWLSNGDRIALQSGHCRVAAADPRTEGCRAGLRLIFRGGDVTILPLICPTCQSVSGDFVSGIDRAATLHGVVFDILVWPVRLRFRFAPATPDTHNRRGRISASLGQKW